VYSSQFGKSAQKWLTLYEFFISTIFAYSCSSFHALLVVPSDVWLGKGRRHGPEKQLLKAQKLVLF
jgi:hypothetical protein